MLKILNKNLIPFLILITLSFVIWHPILKQSFLGEGFYYFDATQTFLNQNISVNLLGTYLSSYDNLARLIFDVLPFFFKDNLVLYQSFAIITIAILTFVVFLLVDFLTKNKWVSVSSSLLFLGSYSGVFELLAAGNYQRFAQRVPNFIFLFISFHLLAKYLESKKPKFLVLSLIVFATTIFMAHFSTFLLPLFAIYPVVYSFLSKNRKKQFLKSVFISLSFIAINLLIISQDIYTPKSDLGGLTDQKGNLIEVMLLQLTSLSYPATLLNQIGQIAQPYTKTAIVLSFPIIAALLLGVFIVNKTEPKYSKLYLTSLLTLFAILFINIVIGKIDATSVIRGDRYYFIPFGFFQENGFSSYGGSRYYFLPTIFISILWSLILWAVLKTRRKLYQVVVVIILLLYLIYNAKLIQTETEAIQPISENMKIYINYAKTHSSDFSSKSIIVTPPDFIWASHIVRLFYGYQEMRFIPLKEGWEKLIDPKDRRNIIILDFDKEKREIVEK